MGWILDLLDYVPLVGASKNVIESSIHLYNGNLEESQSKAVQAVLSGILDIATFGVGGAVVKIGGKAMTKVASKLVAQETSKFATKAVIKAGVEMMGTGVKVVAVAAATTTKKIGQSHINEYSKEGRKTQTHTNSSSEEGGKTQTHTNSSSEEGGKTQTHTNSSSEEGGKTHTHTNSSSEEGGKTQTHTNSSSEEGGKTQTHTNCSKGGGKTQTHTNSSSKKDTKGNKKQGKGKKDEDEQKKNPDKDDQKKDGNGNDGTSKNKPKRGDHVINYAIVSLYGDIIETFLSSQGLKYKDQIKNLPSEIVDDHDEPFQRDVMNNIGYHLVIVGETVEGDNHLTYGDHNLRVLTATVRYMQLLTLQGTNPNDGRLDDKAVEKQKKKVLKQVERMIDKNAFVDDAALEKMTKNQRKLYDEAKETTIKMLRNLIEKAELWVTLILTAERMNKLPGNVTYSAENDDGIHYKISAG